MGVYRRAVPQSPCLCTVGCELPVPVGSMTVRRRCPPRVRGGAAGRHSRALALNSSGTSADARPCAALTGRLVRRKPRTAGGGTPKSTRRLGITLSVHRASAEITLHCANDVDAAGPTNMAQAAPVNTSRFSPRIIEV